MQNHTHLYVWEVVNENRGSSVTTSIYKVIASSKLESKVKALRMAQPNIVSMKCKQVIEDYPLTLTF